ncbi:MAG: hypothetical protein WDN76_01015 [Alphaproteobacteria bacterium]
MAVGLFVVVADPFKHEDAQAALLDASRRAEHEAFTGALVNRQEESLNVARGESLALVLSRAEVPWEQIDSAMTAVSAVYNTRAVRPGQEVDIYYKPSGDKSQLLGFSFRTIRVRRSPFRARRTAASGRRRSSPPWSMQTTHVTTAINGSIYQSALVAGATEKEVAVISNVFAYDVDFQRDVFPGDKFEMLFDRYFDEDGRTVRTGNVYFISLGTRRGVKSYYYFQGPGDRDGAWYDENGRSARKFLMKTPIDGARLSSTFGMRLHPILGYSRMHRGVDFAAGTGTPIKAPAMALSCAPARSARTAIISASITPMATTPPTAIFRASGRASGGRIRAARPIDRLCRRHRRRNGPAPALRSAVQERADQSDEPQARHRPQSGRQRSLAVLKRNVPGSMRSARRAAARPRLSPPLQPARLRRICAAGWNKPGKPFPDRLHNPEPHLRHDHQRRQQPRHTRLIARKRAGKSRRTRPRSPPRPKISTAPNAMNRRRSESARASGLLKDRYVHAIRYSAASAVVM